MANINIKLSKEHEERILGAICDRYAYQDLIEVLNKSGEPEMVPNPMGKLEFVENVIWNLVKGIVIDVEGDKAKANIRRDLAKIKKG